jgi:hypothetical protein
MWKFPVKPAGLGVDVLFPECTFVYQMKHYQFNLGLRFFLFLGFSGCCSSIGLTFVADGSIENKEDNPFSFVVVLVH